ncbi:hypothetical protein PanWU01x14_025660, partial [Parasponia andersonii]
MLVVPSQLNPVATPILVFKIFISSSSFQIKNKKKKNCNKLSLVCTIYKLQFHLRSHLFCTICKLQFHLSYNCPNANQMNIGNPFCQKAVKCASWSIRSHLWGIPRKSLNP